MCSFLGDTEWIFCNSMNSFGGMCEIMCCINLPDVQNKSALWYFAEIPL